MNKQIFCVLCSMCSGQAAAPHAPQEQCNLENLQLNTDAGTFRQAENYSTSVSCLMLLLLAVYIAAMVYKHTQ